MNASTSKILRALIAKSNQRILIPFYHAVSDNQIDFTNNLYTPRKIKDFEKDLDVLLEFYEPISLKKLIELSNSKKEINKNYFHLTFDDGLANFYEVVAPILLKKNIPATVFINTNFVDNKELFYRYKASLLLNFHTISDTTIKDRFHKFIKRNNSSKGKVAIFLLNVKFKNRLELDKLANAVGYDFNEFLKSENPYLSKKKINDLIQQGFTFGAHSLNHPYYSELTLNEQIVQTRNSLNWLEQELGLNYKAFSFPFTDYGVSSNLFSTIYSEKLVDISFGTAGIKVDEQSNHFQRLDCEIGNRKLKKYLIKQYAFFLLKKIFNKHKVNRKL